MKDTLTALVQCVPFPSPIHLNAVGLALNTAIHRLIGDQPLYLPTDRMALIFKGLTNEKTPDAGLMVKSLSDALCLAVEVSLKTREAFFQHPETPNTLIHTTCHSRYKTRLSSEFALTYRGSGIAPFSCAQNSVPVKKGQGTVY